jgi:hypothetical protein
VKRRSSERQEASMYYIVEITSQGIETFLAGFEDIGAAWDVVSGLRCEARRQHRKVRYEVR